MSESEASAIHPEIPAAGDLLVPLTFALPKGKRHPPLLLEFGAQEELVPYLVTSTSGLYWIAKVAKSRVRAAFQHKKSRYDLFRDIVTEVRDTAHSEGWWAVPSLTDIRQAVTWLREREIPSLEILVHPETVWPADMLVDLDGVSLVAGLPLVHADWLPVGRAVVLSSDREYLGACLESQGALLAVLHNAARGMVVVGD